jgi:hypothetical protein
VCGKPPHSARSHGALRSATVIADSRALRQYTDGRSKCGQLCNLQCLAGTYRHAGKPRKHWMGPRRLCKEFPSQSRHGAAPIRGGGISRSGAARSRKGTERGCGGKQSVTGWRRAVPAISTCPEDHTSEIQARLRMVSSNLSSPKRLKTVGRKYFTSKTSARFVHLHQAEPYATGGHFKLPCTSKMAPCYFPASPQKFPDRHTREFVP